VFLNPVGSTDHVVHYGGSRAQNGDGLFSHVVHYGGSRAQNGDGLFFVLGRGRYGFDKKRDRIDYTKHVFFILWDLRAM
jgi:hypothetical protein